MEKKAKGYVVHEATLRELEDIANKETYRYSNVMLREFKVDLGEISDEQKQLQISNKWSAEKNLNIYVLENTYEDKIKETAYNLIFSGERENIAEKTKDIIMNTKIRVVLSTVETINKGKDVGVDFEFGEGGRENVEYTYELDGLEEELKGVKHRNSFSMKENEYVFLERLTIEMQTYRFENMHTRIEKLIKRFVGDNLTYCIKNNKIIIPEEYIKKGKEGIEEWRELKRNNNKNNSMEKRMLKQVFYNKKEFARKSMGQILTKISSTNCDWSLPNITVDGRWNKTKINKLITQVADTKDKQKFLDKSEEEIVKEFKEYWKNKLMEIYKEIDKLEIEDN